MNPRELPGITYIAYRAVLEVEGVAAAENFLQWLVVGVCGQVWKGDDGQPAPTPYDGSVK